ncbi:bifunctional hexulose-6-phosphate synthase/ribonuclease regulator [Euryarchaeota archaeon ex4484_162]|nr:MAG: bifunctional hexulose-6-phosphate synthase/ribonuclease regulator [Euryarchaeota archaeon ex4484_162]
MKPILQVALDLMNAHRAIEIAKESIAGGADWIEAGTPLIKSEGLEIVRQLKKLFPNHTVVADMKTMDTGALETEMASKAGADVVCILGAADDATIKDAIKSARRYGSRIMVDLIGVKDKVSRAREVEKLGADYICLHIGIDEQMVGKKATGFVSSIVKETSLPVAVAGGINSEIAAEIVKAGASIIIVGGAIIKARDVTEATKTIRRAIDEMQHIASKLYKKYDKSELKKAFSLVSTPNICDAMHTKGAMHGIRPIKPGFHMVGRALTVRTMNGDWAKPIEAIDKAGENTVIVVDANGGDIAIWGELATRSAMKKGVAGVVIDGAVRDLDDLLQLDLPIFCKHVSSDAGEPKGFGEIGTEIRCGGVLVRNGDWVIGDDSGVVVVPQEIAQEIANRALDVKERENRIREEIERGSSLGKVLNVKKWEKIIG